jgi:hypothetical protein
MIRKDELSRESRAALQRMTTRTRLVAAIEEIREGVVESCHRRLRSVEPTEACRIAKIQEEAHTAERLCDLILEHQKTE